MTTTVRLNPFEVAYARRLYPWRFAEDYTQWTRRACVSYVKDHKLADFYVFKNPLWFWDDPTAVH